MKNSVIPAKAGIQTYLPIDPTVGPFGKFLLTKPLDSGFRRNDAYGKSLRIVSYLFLIIGLTTSLPAAAKPWAIDYTQSHLGFTGQQSGASFTGGFKHFEATIDFDPAKPESGKITADIDITSITAGDAERDAYLPQSNWFDTKKFPKAAFASTAIRAAAPNCFEASGTLTIKGLAKPVTLPFCLTSEGEHSRATGKLTLQRNDYQIGLGQWSSTDLVAKDVTVTVDIVAR